MFIEPFPPSDRESCLPETLGKAFHDIGWSSSRDPQGALVGVLQRACPYRSTIEDYLRQIKLVGRQKDAWDVDPATLLHNCRRYRFIAIVTVTSIL